MEFKVFLTVCLTVFVAELGDKTQFATIAFAAKDNANPWVVFAGASVGFILSAGFGVALGSWLSGVVAIKTLTLGAGMMFVVLGLLTLFSALRMTS